MPNLEDYRANVRRALEVAEIYFKEHKADYIDLKTVGYYNRVLNHDVLLLYNGEMTEREFVDDLASLIEKQFGRAWREGAKDVGFDISKMTAEDNVALEQRILSEYNYIDNFAKQIAEAAKNGEPIKPFQDRVDMWSNRYTDVQNEARIYFSKGTGQMLEWVYGPTEHCSTCAALNGIVATADEWDASGYKPQGDMLECKGFNCQCELVPTDKQKTKDGIPAGL